MPTPLGTALIEGSDAGISRLEIRSEVSESTTVPNALLPACTQLKAYFEGNLREFDLLLNPEGTDFQKRVWNALLEIPYGRTVSYADLAARLGDSGAVRAVASANAHNPIWILIPCHRVIGSDGSLKGYAGGLGRKRWLLNHESGSCQHSLF